MNEVVHEACPCDACVAARRQMVNETHPLLIKASKPPVPTQIPHAQALAMDLLARDLYREKIAELDIAIKINRDCAGIGEGK